MYLVTYVRLKKDLARYSHRDFVDRRGYIVKEDGNRVYCKADMGDWEERWYDKSELTSNGCGLAFSL